MWTLESGFVLDPTGADGALLDEISSLWGIASVTTLLCLINEPPAGGDVCVKADERGAEVVFVVERDVGPGEELFTDYGPRYERRRYGGVKKGVTIQRDALSKGVDT